MCLFKRKLLTMSLIADHLFAVQLTCPQSSLFVLVTRGILVRMQLHALAFFRSKAVFPTFMVISQNYNYANENPSQIKIVLYFQKGSD